MTMTRSTDSKAFKFFYRNAGWSYGPNETSNEGRRRCAHDYEKAELWATKNGYRFDWQDDPDCSGDGDDTPEERKACIMTDEDGQVVASLWGIGDPSGEYMRVIEAELAVEAMDNL